MHILKHDMMHFETFVSQGGKEPKYRKILMSDVVVTRKRDLFSGRKWNFVDVMMGGWILSVHLLTFFAPFTFTWGAFWVAFCFYVLCGTGITFSYHRNLAHHSFKLPKWLEYTFAYFAVHAAQVLFIYIFFFSEYINRFKHHNKSPVYRRETQYFG